MGSNVESLDYDEAEHTFIEARHQLSLADRSATDYRLVGLTFSFITVLGLLVGSSARARTPSCCHTRQRVFSAINRAQYAETPRRVSVLNSLCHR